MKNKEIWKRLYELIDQIQQLKPWEHMWSSDYVCIEIAPNDYVYCIVMGQLKECIGIAMYEGEEGYRDLLSIDKDYQSSEITKYVMYEQNCLAWYLGNRDEVPPQQLKIIKELELKYRGKNAWPFFISYEKQYTPYSFNDEEAKRFSIILERLLDVLISYIDDKIDVDFDNEEMIFVHYVDNKWIYEAMGLPDKGDKFTSVELCDESLYSELQEQKNTFDELYIDLHYMRSSFEDDKYKRPVNALMFLVYDAKKHMIINGQLLNPDDDEISVVLNYLVNYIFDKGIPSKIYVRNPTVFISIGDIASCCGIKLDMDDFAVIDDIYEEMEYMMGR